MALDYPVEVPFDSLGTVVEIIRAGAISTRTPEFAHALWNVQGYAQKAFIGEPNVLQPLATKDDEGDEKDVFALLEKLLDSKDTPTAQLSMPWQLIASWALQELLKLLGR